MNEEMKTLKRVGLERLLRDKEVINQIVTRGFIL